jgi:hypothetical protein
MHCGLAADSKSDLFSPKDIKRENQMTPVIKNRNFILKNKDVKILMNQKKIEKFSKALKHDKFIWELGGDL